MTTKTIFSFFKKEVRESILGMQPKEAIKRAQTMLRQEERYFK